VRYLRVGYDKTGSGGVRQGMQSLLLGCGESSLDLVCCGLIGPDEAGLDLVGSGWPSLDMARKIPLRKEV
jgi:hypothetical protein